MIISDIRAPKTPGVRSLVVAEDGPISAFLGDAENPAHTQWQKNSGKFKGKYVCGATDLIFVIRSAHEIVNILHEQDQKVDRTLLADFFSISIPLEQPGTRTRGERIAESPAGTESETANPPESRPKPFVISEIKDGFVVKNGKADAKPPPWKLSLKAAYQVRRGNPFKKFRPTDFELRAKLSGAKLIERKENHLEVEIYSRKFRIEVTGFDGKRDVRVSASEREEGDAGPDD